MSDRLKVIADRATVRILQHVDTCAANGIHPQHDFIRGQVLDAINASLEPADTPADTPDLEDDANDESDD